MNCYIVRFRVFPYLTKLQYMLMFAPDEKTAITQVRNVFWEKKVHISSVGVELDDTPVWDNRRERTQPVRARRRAAR